MFHQLHAYCSDSDMARTMYAGNNHLVAFVTPADADVEAAVEDMKQNVPEYMVPESITRLEALPLLPNGKVNRRGLPEPKFGEVPKEEYIAPRSRVEERIQATWHEVVAYNNLSMTDGCMWQSLHGDAQRHIFECKGDGAESP